MNRASARCVVMYGANPERLAPDERGGQGANKAMGGAGLVAVAVVVVVLVIVYGGGGGGGGNGGGIGY